MDQRIDKLQSDLKEVESYRKTQRSLRQRTGVPIVAIVGYTNSGKSTLLNALTEAEVLVEDKLFATLDTTTRKFALPNHQEILLIDTVGFIRKLPHLLVAAFKSTLEESVEADLLVNLLDISDRNSHLHYQATQAVLKELNCQNKPIINVLNKVDRCEDQAQIQRLKLLAPHCIEVSAQEKTGFEELQDAIIKELEKRRTVVFLQVPQKEYKIISEIHRVGKVLKERFEENDVLLQVEIPKELIHKIEPFQVQELSFG